ncbi:MAG: hypothetical protein ABH851_06480 [Methanobacteriota archaeon]
MEKKNKDKKEYSTQRVDLETVTLIKSLNIYFAKRGVRMRQSDLINAAFRFIKTREWEFIEFVESRKIEDHEKLIDTVSRVVSKPWFPYGNYGG